ncbi:unnamed protein product [Linum trigynum]|uniref:Expansin-like EG45 domain-containing protein n=1 Tax=Linum trigynum TaxID=586398 RepID=A0AAV2EHV0_9ROSI
MTTPRQLIMAVLVALSAFCLFLCHPCAAQTTATFYAPPYTPSRCYGNEDHGVMVAAANEDTLWDGGNACGKSYRVKCLSETNGGVAVQCREGETVTVKIVDVCPSGCRGTIVLSREAFATIAVLDEEKIFVEQRISVSLET